MKKRIVPLLAVIVILGAAAWHAFKPGTEAKANTTPMQSVTTVSAKKMDIPVRLEANGNVSSLNSVDIRPQISNVIAKVHIREGQFVKAGDVLFSLDDRAERVNLQKAQAQLAKDEASLADLERQYTRSKDLLAKGFISQGATDTAQAQVEAQRAAVQADKAAVEAARVSLGYDTIRATAGGRAGAINVYPGSLVSATGNPLVTISQIDPIAITFTLPETELNSLLAAQKQGDVKVNAITQDGKTTVQGKLTFIDNAVDSQSGMIKVKAEFPNAEHLLWPGQYVQVNTTVRNLDGAIVIPQAAIIAGIDNKTVYVASADMTAQQRKVDVIYSFGTQAAVKGVNADERVVVDGKQNLRPGIKLREVGAAQADKRTASEDVKGDGAKSDKS